MRRRLQGQRRWRRLLGDLVVVEGLVIVGDAAAAAAGATATAVVFRV
jgi:hypothetical protein